MKKLSKIFVSLLCAACLAIPVGVAACDDTDPKPGPGPGPDPAEFVDYTSELSLDMTSETYKQEVTVRQYIDGDTTHFDPVTNSELTPGTDLSAFDVTVGYIKARYLAINTPESTGQIEKWGKTASNFTHDKLESCKNGGSIIVESDDGSWNADSTGERFMLWIWYKPAGATAYRNLNLEILQEGFAVGSSTANNRYGSVAMKALNQAKDFELHVFSPANTVDVNWFGEEAIELSLKELRCHAEDYLQMPVRVEGTVVAYFSNTIFIQDYDAETETYYGMQIFDGYATGPVVEVFAVGNRVSVYGNVTEFSSTYQMSGIKYDIFDPDNPKNSIKLDGNQEIVFTEVDAKNIVSGSLDVDFYDEESETTETVHMDYGEAIMSTAVTVLNLHVDSFSVTDNGGKNDGAISLRCTASDGTSITVRTVVLTENGVTVTGDRFAGKDINVKGVVEKYVPDSTKPDKYYYQVKVYRLDFIEIL